MKAVSASGDTPPEKLVDAINSLLSQVRIAIAQGESDSH